MKNTPCTQCIYLQGIRGNWKCGSLKEDLEDSIVLQTDVEGLPDCPYFIRASSKKSEDVKFDPEPKILVASSKKRKRRRRRTPPERYRTQEETDELVVQAIKDLREIYNEWPTMSEILNRSHLRSIGTLHTVLGRLEANGRVKKFWAPKGRHQYRFSVAR